MAMDYGVFRIVSLSHTCSEPQITVGLNYVIRLYAESQNLESA